MDGPVTLIGSRHSPTDSSGTDTRQSLMDAQLIQIDRRRTAVVISHVSEQKELDVVSVSAGFAETYLYTKSYFSHYVRDI